MADTFTPNYALVKPGVGESKDTWGGKLNQNTDAIDTALKALADALALKLAAAGYTAADVLAKLVTVDGTGSGLDADFLDGHDSAYFAQASQVTAAALLAALLTVDGAGSGLDADTLDGHDTAFFATAAHTHTYVPLAGGAGAGNEMTGNLRRTGAGAHLYFADSALTSPRVFLTPATDPDPTSQPGDIWLTY
jgi:hypothetical protein